MAGTDISLDYEQTACYFKELHEARFRLLALLPIVSGAAIALLPENTTRSGEIALGVFGFMVTVGLCIYDQRNTQIYDRLVKRGRLLERRMGLMPMQLQPEDANRLVGGCFTDRPPRREFLGIRVLWHDLGLAIVYASTLSGWVFLLVDGVLRDASTNSHPQDGLTLWYLPLIAWLLAFAALMHLARRNDEETDRIEGWIQTQPRGDMGEQRANSGPQPDGTAGTAPRG